MNQTQAIEANQQSQNKLNIEEMLSNYKFMMVLTVCENKAARMVDGEYLKKLCTLMLLFMVLEKFDEALKLADLILVHKENYKIYVQKHIIYLHQLNLEEALQIIMKAYEIKPISKYLNAIIGIFYQNQKQLDEALKYLKRAVEYKEDYFIFHQIGLILQETEQHNEAIQYFTKACNISQKNKFYIAKMNSYKALRLYDEALECIQIAILNKPQKSIYYILKKDILSLQGKDSEVNNLQEQLDTMNTDYSYVHFIEKRKQENDKVLLQKRQSSIIFKPKKTSTIIKVSSKQINLYIDAFYFTISYFLIHLVEEEKQILEKQIVNNLNVHQNIHIENFQKLILYFLKELFFGIAELEDKKINERLNLWLKRKIAINSENGNNIFQSLHANFNSVINSQSVVDLISERIGEDFEKSAERQKTQKELIYVINSICNECKKQDVNIYDSIASQIGLEHALFLLGFMILLPELASDEENFSTLVYRSFHQKDLQQLYKSQSNLRTGIKKMKEKENLSTNNTIFSQKLYQVKKKYPFIILLIRQTPKKLQIVQNETQKQEQRRMRLNPIEQFFLIMMLDSQAPQSISQVIKFAKYTNNIFRQKIISIKKEVQVPKQYSKQLQYSPIPNQDEFYFTFTFIFLSGTQRGLQDIALEIDFTEFIKSISSQKLKKMDDKQIECNLLDWTNLKMKKAIRDSLVVFAKSLIIKSGQLVLEQALLLFGNKLALMAIQFGDYLFINYGFADRNSLIEIIQPSIFLLDYNSMTTSQAKNEQGQVLKRLDLMAQVRQLARLKILVIQLIVGRIFGLVNFIQIRRKFKIDHKIVPVDLKSHYLNKFIREGQSTKYQALFIIIVIVIIIILKFKIFIIYQILLGTLINFNFYQQIILMNANDLEKGEQALNQLLNPMKHFFVFMMIENEAQRLVRDEALKPICRNMLVHILKEEFDQAHQLADQLLTKKENYKIYIVKHKIFLCQKKYDEALQIILKAFNIKPISKRINLIIGITSLSLQGQFYIKQSNNEEALKYLKRAVDRKPDFNILYQIGILLQNSEKHNEAIKYFRDAYTLNQKNKFLIAQMNSFKALKLYDEALACCQITILDKPQKQKYQMYQKDILKLQGKELEIDDLQEQLNKLSQNYSHEHYQLKRELEIQKVMMQKKLSTIIKKPNQSKIEQSQSQIKALKAQNQINQYIDAFYFSFTYFLTSYAGYEQLEIEKQITLNLFTKQNINFQNFDKLILHSLKELFVGISDLEDLKIAQRINQWLKQKIDNQENGSIYKFLFDLLNKILNSQNVIDLIKERELEDFSKKLERQKAQKDLICVLNCICQESKKFNVSIYDCNYLSNKLAITGQLGLEHALFLLGFMILLPQLANDYENLENIIWRSLKQSDLQELYKSQSTLRQNLKQQFQNKK